MTSYRPDGLEDTFSTTDTHDSAGDASSAARDEAAPARGSASPQLPSLGVVGWGRWAWRQLSMRVALLLLMLLAVAAVPGTMFPQNTQDPAKVAEYVVDHPTTGPWLERLGLFDVYSSIWFSAIYLMLSISLVGCILPRTRAHLAALRGRPPRTPRRLTRFPARVEATSDATPEQVVLAARDELRRDRVAAVRAVLPGGRARRRAGQMVGLG